MKIPGSWHSRGVTMVELLVAMVIGIFLIGGAASIFIATKRSYTEVERSGRMIENARFALQTLEMDLRHAGFYGEAAPPGISLADSLDRTVTGDCSGRAAAYKVDDYIFVARADASGKAVGCITDAVPGSDVIVIKGVRPHLVSGALDDEQPYVIANAIQGLLFDGADTPPSTSVGGDVPGGNAWEYRFLVYYVRAGDVPRLSRKVLRWNGTRMGVVTEDIVDGVENLRVRVGTDSDDNGEVDRYRSADDAAIEWGRVMAMEVHMLVRSTDQDPAYTDQRSYDLAGTTVTPGGKFHRTVLDTAVSIRNPKLLIRGNI